MAQFFPRIGLNVFASLALMIGALGVVGCQQQTAMVPLPDPNFSGPVVTPSAPPRYQPAPLPPYVGRVRPPAVARSAEPKDWIPHVPPRHWQFIIVHHSATPAGGAARFDREHRAKGWDELGYDFVIGNGTDTRDGQIEVGPRWIKQKWGAHTKTPDNMYNEVGVGICLVGNFQQDYPTAAQMRSLAKLDAFLMRQYHIPVDHIIGHRDTKPTECPGKNLSIATVRRMSQRDLIAEGGSSEAPIARTASAGELMIDSK
jgi:hypothetical protein